MNRRPSSRVLGSLVSTLLLAAFGFALSAAPIQAQTAVGSTSATQTATVTITTAGMLSKVAVLTQGATGLDFQAATAVAGDCTVGTNYNVLDTCTVHYTFSPTHPWVRYGGIALSDAPGNLLGNVYLTGQGTGPQVSYPPSTTTAATTLTSGSPGSVAIDGNGNVYFTDSAAHSVKEIVAVGGVIPASPTVNTVATGFSSPGGIAIDGSGNLFVADGGSLKEIVAVGGAIPASPTIRTVVSGFSVEGIAVDGAGNVYVADVSSHAVKKIAAVNGVIPAAPAPSTLTSANVDGIAVDAAGDVFYNDGTSTIKELVGGAGAPVTVATVTGINALSIDGSGDLYVTTSGTNTVVEVVAVGGVIPASPATPTLGAAFTGPVGLTVDGSGNIFVADSAAVKELSVQTPPTITFTSAGTGTDSSDSPMTLTIGNNGYDPAATDPLVFTTQVTSPSDFVLSGGTCTTLVTGLAAGATCTDLLTFHPTALGPVAGTLTSTDNNLNVAAANQVVPLAGGVATPTIAVTSFSTAVDTTNNTLTAVITFDGLRPGGAFAFTVNGSGAGVNGPDCEPTNATTTTCTSLFDASVAGLAVGTYPIVATLDSDVSNKPATGNGTLSITVGTPGLTVGTSNASVPVNTQLTFTANVTPTSGVTPSGKVSFTSTLGAGSPTAIAGCTNVTVTAGTAKCITSALTPGSYTITANLAGDTNFTAQSATVGQTVTTATPGLTVGTSNASVPVNTQLTFTANVTPTSGITPSGKVSFTSTLGAGSPVAIAGCTNVTPTAGAATCQTSALTAGSYTITANLAGDTNFTAQSATVAQTVTTATPGLAVGTSNASVPVNTQLTFTANVTPTSGITPSGKVSFTSTLGAGSPVAIAGCTNVTPTAGAATCQTSALTAGSYTITANLASDTNFTAKSATVSQTVTKVTPGVALSTTNATPTVNGSVTLTATITPNTGIIPTGAVSFTTTLSGNTTPIAGCTSVALVNGATLTATCTTSLLNAGSNSIGASIALDNNFNVASATAITETVSKATPAVVLTASGTGTSPLNGSVTFTATVTPNTGVIPGGKVSFTTTLNGNTTPIAGCTAVTLTPGTPLTATCTTSLLNAGSNSIGASIALDSNFNTASATAITETVTQGTPTITENNSPTGTTTNGTETLTATILPNTGVIPTGTVSFTTTLNGTTTPIPGCNAVALVNGASLTATCVTTALQAGGNSITASLAGDSNFVPAATASTPLITISTANTTLATTSSGSPSTVDQSVTFTATVSSTFPFTTSPTGTVFFTANGSVIPGCDLAPLSTTTHTATCTTSSLVAPSDVIVASYVSGDVNFNNSTAPNLTQVVTKDVTVNTVSSSLPTTAVVNQTVTFTATITPNNASAIGVSPSGSVAFTKGGTTVCGPAVVTSNPNGTGTASCSVAFTSAFASTPILATYSGDSNFTAGNAPTVAQTVLIAPTTTTVSSPVNPSTVNQSVNLSASFVPTNTGANFPGSATPQTGTVSFSDSLDAGGPFCTTTITAGTPNPVTCAHVFTTAGNHIITATYSGDANFAGSTSANLTQQVNASGTEGITVGTTTPTLTVNQNGTFTAAFTPAIVGTQPTGTVSYFDSLLGASPISTCTSLAVTVAGTIPNCVETMLVAGTHNIKAVFTSGDGNFPNITSPIFAQVVAQNTTSVTLTSPTTPSVTDQTLTFAATVTPGTLAPTGPGTTVPSGNVVFTYVLNGTTTTICTAPVSTTGGVTSATCNAAFTTAGNYAVTATYSGDSNFQTAASTPHAQPVNKAATSVGLNGGTLSSPASPAVNQSATYTVQITATAPANTAAAGSSVPTGSVVFTDTTTSSTCTAVVQPTGLASCSFADPTAGAHMVTAAYSGDANFSASTNTFPQSIGLSGTSVNNVTVTPGSPAVNQTATLNATVTANNSSGTIPTGTVTFSDIFAGQPTTTCMSQITSGVVAACTHLFTSAGNHTLTAAYSGDANFGASSSSITVTVGAAGTVTINLATTTPAPTVDQTATFTATFAGLPGGGAQPNGTVSYYDTLAGAGSISTCTNLAVVSGVIPNCTETMLVAGTHNISAVFTTSDSNFQNITSPLFPEIVAQNTTTVTLTSPTSASVTDQVLTFAATVTPGALTPAGPGTTVPGGSVAFTYVLSGVTTTICTAPVSTTGGVSSASCTAALTAAGTYPVTATYSGDTNFKTSASTPHSQTVNKEGTTLALVGATLSSPASPAVNQQATYSIQVLLAGGISDAGLTVPTGNVTFTDSVSGMSCSGVVQAATGQASCQFAEPTASSPTIVVTYSGDANFSTSTTSYTLTIQKSGTAVTNITATPANPAVNQSTALNATVTATNPLGTIPTGSVTFTDTLAGSTSTCVSQITGGVVAACTHLFTAAGNHTVTAAYSGDSNFSPSSSSITVTVGAAAATTIQVATTTPAPIVNQNANFTATFVGLPPGGAQPEGTVSYYDSLLGSSPISTCTNLTVTAGVIPNCIETMLVAGTHNITAAFTSGNNNFQNISSSLFPEVVSQNSTSVTVNSPNGTSVVDQVLTFTATVTPAALTPAGAGSTVPTGSVAFTYSLNGNTVPICSPTVSTTAGVTTATCSAALTVAGSYAVTATYSGDTNFTTSASAPHAETVNKEGTSLALISGATLASPASPVVGQPGTYSVQLLLANGISDAGLTLPTGNVVFTDAATPSATCTAVIQGSTGQASCQFPEATSGVHNINVTYVGDSNFSTSTASFPVTIAAGAPIVGLTSSSAGNTSTATQTVIFTATAIAPPNGTTPSNPVPLNFAFSITQGASSLPCDNGSYTQGVNGTTDVATCKVTFPSSVVGAFAVKVTYNGDANYGSASASLTQTILNFVPTVVVTAGSPAVPVTPAHVTLSQGSTVIANTTVADAFRGPESITFTKVWQPTDPGDTLAATGCVLSPLVTGLTCAPTTDGTGVIFTATTAAAVGDYTAVMTVTDTKTPTLFQTAQVPVTVVAQPTAVFTAAVGTTTATFTLPPSLAAAASTLQCNSGLVKTSAANGTYVTGPNSTFAQIGIACSSITSTTTAGVTTYSFVITAGQPGTAKLETGNSTILAATLGAPFLLLFGLLPAFRKQRKLLVRGLGMLLLGIAIIQTTGCGGGGFTHATPPQAVTGSYLIGIVNSAGVTVAEVPLVIGNN